jgi:transposase-like protein
MVNSIRNTNGPIEQQASTPQDPQVKAPKKYRPRRVFTASCKARLLADYEACPTPAERGAFLRREGLYYSSISTWRKELSAGSGGSGKGKQATTRSDHLARENAQLRKKLAHAEAIIDLQKKVSTLFGLSVHSPGNSEEI